MDDFFTNCYVEPVNQYDVGKIEQLFNRYKSKGYFQVLDLGSMKIEGEGIEKMCGDLGIDVLDPVTLVISFYFKADRMVRMKMEKLGIV